jgi:hypothetical protein
MAKKTAPKGYKTMRNKANTPWPKGKGSRGGKGGATGVGAG